MTDDALRPRGINRRTLLQSAAAATALSTVGSGASLAASQWPQRTVTIIVPYAAGGNSDMMARLCAKYLSEKVGKPFIIENRAGGSGAPAAVATARAEPDGCTVLFGPCAPYVTVPMIQKVAYTADSFTPINNFASYPFLLGVKSSLPVKSVPELIAYAKANPGKLNYASAGVGAISHLVSALFMAKTGMDVVHVPYKGAAPANVAILTGEVDIIFSGVSELQAHLSSEDKVRVIGTTGANKLADFPKVPLISESLPGFTMEAWNGIVGPKGIPQDIVGRFSALIAEAANSPFVSEKLKSVGIFPVTSTAQEFARTIESDKVLYRDALKAAGLV